MRATDSSIPRRTFFVEPTGAVGRKGVFCRRVVLLLLLPSSGGHGALLTGRHLYRAYRGAFALMVTQSCGCIGGGGDDADDRATALTTKRFLVSRRARKSDIDSDQRNRMRG